jgi:N6-L-threonylcarbamoyladenine synthase
MPIVLAIESSCDETAVAIMTGTPGETPRLLSSVVSSQIELHRVYGGVVPELASRNHSLRLRPLIDQALADAGVSIRQIDTFAATAGPGLASSLLIGNTTAKALAAACHKPFLAINHLEGHLLSPFVGTTQVPPHTALVISGGHTLLLDVSGPGSYRLLGRTRDDAAGEAFDKVGKMLGLPYPGGPEVESRAHSGNPAAFAFPRSMIHELNFDFSFSGLKTAVLYTLTDLSPTDGTPPPERIPDLCASFQQAVCDVLVAKTLRAAKQSGHPLIALSGGVSLNRTVRQSFEAACQAAHLGLALADPSLCTDNAAMIAYAALLRSFNGQSSPLDQDINPNLRLA